MAIALAAGAVAAAVTAFVSPRIRWLVGAALPAIVLHLGTGAVGAYVESFIVKPNELVREQPYITHNIEFTRQAYGLNRFAQRAFPAETTVEAADAANNQATLQNIRLWDWRVLQDTLRQLQEIRTYYDFPDIDIDRYVIDGTLRQVMLATRELNTAKLPESSRTWINEKLIYTHGYGLTMNAVNGFTPEGLPTLLLKDMPVQSASPEPHGDAPGGLLRRDDEHRRLRQDASAGVQLPAGPDQQPDLVRRQRRHRAGRPHPPAADRARSRGHRQAAVQRRRDRRDQTADAPERPRPRSGARTVSPVRSRSLHRHRSRRPAFVDDGCVHDIGSLSVFQGVSCSKASGSTTCATASRR